MKARTKRFALRVIKLVDALPKSPAAYTIGKQLLRCGTSVGANYRSACRAKSTADFISKLSIVEEEADECVYWIELLAESGIVHEHLVSDLTGEANQITAIMVKSIKTSKLRRIPKSQSSNRATESPNSKPKVADHRFASSNPTSAFPNPKST